MEYLARRYYIDNGRLPVRKRNCGLSVNTYCELSMVTAVVDRRATGGIEIHHHIVWLQAYRPLQITLSDGYGHLPAIIPTWRRSSVPGCARP